MFGGLLRRFAGGAAQASGKSGKRGKPTMRYLRPDGAGILKAHNPSLRSKADDVQGAYTKVAAMVVDAAQNQGWIAGAVDQGVVDINGPKGLMLSATPDYEELGWTKDYADGWSRRIERRFKAYANNPLEVDARGKQTLAGLADAWIRMWYFYGESTARMLVKPRPGSRYSSRVQLFAPHRLVQDRSDLDGLHQGVFLDSDGLVVGYRIKTRVDGFDRTIDLPARDRDGRPIIVHVFDGDPDQTRGISPLAPALRVTRQRDTLADATLTAALLQTIFAATLKSAAPSAEAFEGMIEDAKAGAGLTDPGGVAAMMEMRDGFYDGASVDLGTHGKVAHLWPGDEFEMHTSNHPGGNYLPFDRQLGREIAACIGVTYEGFSGDYEGTSYAALNLGIATKYPHVERRRERVPVPLYQAAYEAWLEEDIATGRTPFPGGYSAFLRNRVAASQANWLGPPMPKADDLKSAKAAEVRHGLGYSLQTILAGDGLDWQTEFDQRGRESAYAIANGQPDPHAPKTAPGVDPNDPDLAEDPPRGRPAG
ncbi:phage portal protein [Caulobacter sp. RL271]|uniref:Phage portal protein n=1 Tax=Caulobacter segnis TaxID=88688 RepID=A0ABY4ZWP5_9CAUL|nr:phage portal protein [Caulobacter segnis]USQ97252.1 phage portal protein [Caulobacter segnis]